ncbi:MAG: hypothetical protein RLZZ117_2639 [Cyanobacteriota bacterium]|jgi:hypothetical protein
MAILNVPGTYSSIRAALIAAGNGDTIEIASGSFDITFPGFNNSLAYSAAPNCSTGFINGVTTLTYDGAGNSNDGSVTTITGNARLFQKNADGTPPVSVTYRDLDFLYSGASGYILQTGDFGVSEANTLTKSIILDNVSFRGTHAGTASASGNYSAVLGIRNFSLNNSIVSLAGQAGFTGGSVNSGGSSFLMLSGGQGAGGSISITDNTFDESGYRNALSIFDSQSVTLTGNTFSRGTGTQFVRTNGAGVPKSNKIANSTGVTIGAAGATPSNTFANGSFLSLEGGSGTLVNNLFTGQNVTLSSTYGDPGAIGILLENHTATNTNPAYTYTQNSFRFVSPFVNLTSAIQTVTTNGTADNTIANPNNGNALAIQQFVTGTSAGEVVASTTSNRSDFLSGGLGNDTLNGGVIGATIDNDFFLFDTVPDTNTNWDTIINFQPNPGGTNTDRLVLSRAIYRDLTTTSVVAGAGGLNGIGVLLQNTAGGGQIFNSGSSVNFTTAAQRIGLITSGADQGTLWYDRDGSGGTYSPVRFARIFTDNGVTGLNSVSALGNVFVI